MLVVQIHPGQPSRDVAQSAEPLAHIEQVAGAIPAVPTIVPERKVVERSPSQGESLAGASPAGNASVCPRSSVYRAPPCEGGGHRRNSCRGHHLPLCLQKLQGGFRKPVIVGASLTRGSNFSARGSRGTADPPDSESGSLERASRSAPHISYSRVAQQWSRRLLTGTVVRIHPREPALNGDHGVRAASLLVRQKARGQHPLVTPISSGNRASERLRLQPASAGSVTLAGLQSPRQ